MEQRLTGTVHRRDEVAGGDVEKLYALFARYYSAVDRATFRRDWDEKDWAILLAGEDGALRGFTTMKLFEVEVLGRRVRALFSGNTIIDQDCWGEQTLARTWGRFMAELRDEDPSAPLYWFLISSGFRTYLYLPLFFRDFHPACGRPTPPFERRLIDHLGRMKFPDEYRDGIVHVRAPRECLRRELAVPSPARLRNPHVRFFVERNPGYLRGDELVCVAEFSPANALRLARECILARQEAACALI